MIAVRAVEDLDALASRSGEWNALAARAATATVFQTFEWHASWWAAFGAGARLLVLLAEEAGRMIAIAPLMVSEHRSLGRRRRVVEFIGTHASDYSDFIVEPGRGDALDELLGWLAARAAEWDMLHLVNIAETSPLRGALPGRFASLGYTADVHALYECPTRLLGDRAADAKQLRKKDLRENANRLRRRGELAFRIHEDAGEIERQLDEFFRQHVERWAGTSTPSFFADERQRRFYRELVRRMAPQGWIFLSTVSFERAPISFQFGFVHDGRLLCIKSTYSAQFREYGPGMLQMGFVLEHAMARGLRELDLTVGEEPYKYRFANHARVNYVARVHAPWLFYGLDRALARAKAAVRGSPRLRRLGRRVLARWLGDSHKLVGM